MPEPATLREMLWREFGVRTSIRENNVTCGVTPTVLAPNNPNRLGLIISNTGVNNVLIRPHPEVSATSGVFLAATGGGMNLKWNVDFDMVAPAWYGIALVGVSTVYVLEVVTIAPLPPP